MGEYKLFTKEDRYKVFLELGERTLDKVDEEEIALYLELYEEFKNK